MRARIPLVNIVLIYQDYINRRLEYNFEELYENRRLEYNFEELYENRRLEYNFE